MVDFAQLEDEIKKIVAIADALPEKYQVKCFELLVNALIAGFTPTVVETPTEVKPKPQNTQPFKLPITVRAFLTQYNLTEDVISKLFVIEGNQISPAYNIVETKLSTAQMQVSLLLAFENALLSSKFSFSIEKARERCQQNKCYDMHNFMGNFRANKRLFNSLTDPENVELSPDGKSELADVISGLIK